MPDGKPGDGSVLEILETEALVVMNIFCPHMCTIETRVLRI